MNRDLSIDTANVTPHFSPCWRDYLINFLLHSFGEQQSTIADGKAG